MADATPGAEVPRRGARGSKRESPMRRDRLATDRNVSAPVPEALREAGHRAAELARNPVARSLLAAGLVTAAAALAANRNVRESAKRGARQAQAAAEAEADAAVESANKIGAAMINAATEAVRRMMWETTIPSAIETSEGMGLGDRLSLEDGFSRLAKYAGYRPIESWAGEVAGAGLLQAKLGVPRSTLNDWRKRGVIIGLLRGERKHVYPLEQFVDARPMRGIGAVSRAVGDSREAWLWLRQPHGQFDMKAPLWALRGGRIDEVVAAADRDFR